MTTISARGLSKTYKMRKQAKGFWPNLRSFFAPEMLEVRAVSDLTFEIGAGEMVGLIGINGAGKSTTLKMLCGILQPTRGALLVNGIIPTKNRIAHTKTIGAVFGQRSQLWWDLPVRDSFLFWQKIHTIPAGAYRATLDLLCHELELEALLEVPVRLLSLGQKMKCEIALAYLHSPSIVFLDEPTIGLDIVTKDKIKRFIRSINTAKGATTILTSHDLRDVEELCSRIILIDRGQLRFDGSLSELLHKYRRPSVMTVEVETRRKTLAAGFLKSLGSDVRARVQAPNSIEIYFDRNKTPVTRIINKISRVGEIVDLKVEHASLESIVKSLYANSRV